MLHYVEAGCVERALDAQNAHQAAMPELHHARHKHDLLCIHHSPMQEKNWGNLVVAIDPALLGDPEAIKARMQVVLDR